MGWEERYQQQDTPWDKGAPAPPLIDLLSTRLPLFGTGRIYVPGCGRGHDALAIARKLPHNEVVGLDISPSAIRMAQELDHNNLVSYQQRDFLSSPPPQNNPVTAIFEHTCFCAIDPDQRLQYTAACSRILPTGGHWIAIIFLTPRDEDDPTIGPPFQSSREEIKNLFQDDFDLVEAFVPENTFAARSGKELVMIWRKK